MLPPWGAPVAGGTPWPSVSRRPACSPGRMRRSKAQSSLRSRSMVKSRGGASWAKQPGPSASPREPYGPYWRSQGRSRTASSAPRPGREPSRHSSKSCAERALNRFAPAHGPRLSASAGIPHGLAAPFACGMAPRRTRVARSRCVVRRGPTAVLCACTWAWEAAAVRPSTPLAACCFRSRQPSSTRSASPHPDSSRQRCGWSVVALWALPCRAVGCWGSAPTVSGRSGLCGRRPAVMSFPGWGAFPTSEASA
jgi:hypothetical protein